MIRNIVIAIALLVGLGYVALKVGTLERHAQKIPPTGAPAPRPPPAKANGHPRTIDEILRNMPWGNIAFNAPDTLNLRETAQIQLLLDLNQSIEELSRQIEAKGRVEGARIRVGNRMEARLVGKGFDITPITPETQAISGSTSTEWRWEVKPTATGPHALHLTLSALVNVDGASTPRAIRTFQKTIDVNVTWAQSATEFIRGNWQWLWAAVLVPVAGWLWSRRKSPPKKKTKK